MDDTAALLHDELRAARVAVVGKLDGLSEYDVRRPLTVTGTNLLGLIKHLATWESRYLGDVFGRPAPDRLPRWQDADGSDLWAREDETRAEILAFYDRACRHADVTITELPLTTAGHVPWWPRPDTTLLDVVVHVLLDTTRHAGHADILREQLDGQTGDDPTRAADLVARAGRYERVDRAARAAAERPDDPDPRSVRPLCASGRAWFSARVRPTQGEKCRRPTPRSNG